MYQCILFAFAFVMCIFEHKSLADFGFQHYSVTDPAELKRLGLKCIPGRTVLKVAAPPAPEKAESDDSSLEDDEEDGRRTHMRLPLGDDESCQICVCSTEGKDEYCSKRPANNVNECIRLANLKAEEIKHPPFNHMKSLPQMIRVGYYGYSASKESISQWNVCIPYASTYSDCSTVENICSGCNRCDCNQHGQWECEHIQSCPKDKKDHVIEVSSSEFASEEPEFEDETDIRLVKPSSIKDQLDSAKIVGYIVAVNE